jgi:hypothetical protein
MCVVPSTAVFCSESIKCFPGVASKFFLKTFVTIPVAPVITGIPYISGPTVDVSLYIKSCILAYFPLPFARHFSLQVATSISTHVFSFLFLIVISSLLLLLSLSSSSSSFLVINVLGQQPSDLCYGLYVEHKDHNIGLHAHIKTRKNKNIR